MLTKKDYFLLAKTLKEAKRAFPDNVEVNGFYYYFTNKLISALKADNPAFSETRFKIALYDEGRMAKTRGNLSKEEEEEAS